MKNILFLTLLILGITQCTRLNVKIEDFQAETQLNPKEQKAFINKIIYNVGKWPESANKNTVKHPHYEEDFINEAKLHQLKFYYKQKDTVYFGIWKVAPSLKEKYRLTAGKLIMGNEGPTYYEEVFRTWKMTPEELKEKGELLFQKWLNGENITPYYNHLSGDEEWIEFPDKDVNWDKEKQTWVSPNLQVMESLYLEKRTKMEEILKKKDSISHVEKMKKAK
jgi:hypothetical protein